MWANIRKHYLLSAILMMILLVLISDGWLLKALMILLFTGGIPNTSMYIPAPLMLIGWAAAGIAFLLWIGRRLTVTPMATPITGKAYYHKATTKKSLRGQALTRQRAVRRRSTKLAD